MNSVLALVPIRASGAKSRLAGALAPTERLALTRFMAEDVLRVLRRVRGIDEVEVMTDDKVHGALATELGCLVRAEQGVGLNAGLNRLAREARDRGIDTLLVVPGDIPAARPGDFEKLIDAHDCSTPGVTLVAAATDGGTNAILCTPPDVIEFEFGDDSANRHLKKARLAGGQVKTLSKPAIERDIDRPGDLQWLVSSDSRSLAAVFLRDLGMLNRLTEQKMSCTG